MKAVKIFCDGGCQGNPGPGAWAAILQHDGREKVISGQAPQTTNNRMELTAALETLSALKEPCQIAVASDSQYLVKGMTQWIVGWVKNGWKNSKNKDVENRDLWEKLLEVSKTHKISWQWVQGHAGHPQNERCHKIIEETLAGNPVKPNRMTKDVSRAEQGLREFLDAIQRGDLVVDNLPMELREKLTNLLGDT